MNASLFIDYEIAPPLVINERSLDEEASREFARTAAAGYADAVEEVPLKDYSMQRLQVGDVMPAGTAVDTTVPPGADALDGDVGTGSATSDAVITDLPDPATSKYLCHNDLDDVPNILYCDPSGLNRNTESKKYNRYNALAALSLRAQYTNSSIGFGMIGPSSKLDMDSLAASTYAKWHFNDQPNGLLVLIKQEKDGAVTFGSFCNPSMGSLVSVDMLRRIQDNLQDKLKSKSKVTRPVIALMEIADFLSLELTQKIKLPRQKAQLVVLSVIFSVTAFLFLAGLIGALRLVAANQRARPKKRGVTRPANS